MLPPSNAYRNLTLTLSALVLLSNCATAYITTLIPDDPYHLAAHVALYSCLGCAVSLLGFLGAKRRSANLVTIFANYLVIDVLISALPRILVVMVFPRTRALFCEGEAAGLQQCRTAVGLVQAVMGLLAVGLTGVQVLLAMRVCVYAGLLRREERLAKGESGDVVGVGRVVEVVGDEKGSGELGLRKE